MTLDFGLDMIPASFTGEIGSVSVQGPSVFIGEITFTSGVIPPGETVPKKNYAF